MDEEDAAAPVGGDRGRGPRDPGSPPGLRREAGAQGGAWRSCPEASPVGTLAPRQAWGGWASSSDRLAAAPRALLSVAGRVEAGLVLPPLAGATAAGLWGSRCPEVWGAGATSDQPWPREDRHRLPAGAYPSGPALTKHLLCAEHCQA